MARIRTSARDAGKHSGEQYSQGFQYRDPEYIAVELGPWKNLGYGSGSEIMEQKDRISYLSNGIIKDGFIAPILADVEIISSSYDTIIGMYEVTVGTTAYLLIFCRTAANTLKVAYSTTGAISENTYATIAVTTDDHIRGFQWGNYFYFGSPGIATGLVRYTISTPAINEPATAHGALYDLFLIDNNAISVEISSNTWLVSWSVDSLPEDWTGAGSGSKSYYDAKYLCTAPLSRYGIMVFDKYAERIEATGTADPSFMFSRIEGIAGGYSRDCVIAFANQVVYLDASRKLISFNGDSSQIIDYDTDVSYGANPILFYLHHLELLLLSFPITTAGNPSLLYDVSMNKVGQIATDPVNTVTFNNKLYLNYISGSSKYLATYDLVNLDSTVTTITTPIVILGIFDFSEGTILESVDIYHRQIPYPSGLDLSISAYQDQAATYTSTSFTAPGLATLYGGKYHTEVAGRGFNLTISGGTWTNTAAIKKVVLNIRRQKLV